MVYNETTSLETFVDIINFYAEIHGLAPITISTVRELMDESIIPRPARPGQGKGKGRPAIYSDQAFRRAMTVLELKKAGLCRFSQIRLWFFFKYLNRVAAGRPAVLDIPEHLIKHDLQQEFKRLVKKASSGAEIFGQTSLSKRQKKIDVVVDSVHETPELSKKVHKKALSNWLNSIYGLGSNVPFVPDNFNHNVEHLFSNGVQWFCVLEENPILEGFNDLFPKEVSFVDWSIEVFRFMQHLIQRNPMVAQYISKETVSDFLEQDTEMFMLTLYICRIIPAAYGTSAEWLLFQPAEAGSQET